MKRNVLAIPFFLFLVFILAHPGATVTGKDIFKLKKAGVSDKTIQLIVKEKVIETAAFSVDDIVNMKKAGVTEKTLRILIKEGSFLSNSEPIVTAGKHSLSAISTPRMSSILKTMGLATVSLSPS